MAKYHPFKDKICSCGKKYQKGICSICDEECYDCLDCKHGHAGCGCDDGTFVPVMGKGYYYIQYYENGGVYFCKTCNNPLVAVRCRAKGCGRGLYSCPRCRHKATYYCGCEAGDEE